MKRKKEYFLIAILIGVTVFASYKINSRYYKQLNTESVTIISSRKKIIPKPVTEVSAKSHKLELNENNTAVFRGAFTTKNVSKIFKEIVELDFKLPQDTPIYLVMDSPGGSIAAGSFLIDAIKGLNRPVHTITIFSASMAFITTQALGHRYTLKFSTFMGHRARLEGLGGELPGQIFSRLNYIYDIVRKLEHISANRMRVSIKKYDDLVKDEYWVVGSDAIKEGVADSLASIKCSQKLIDLTDEINVRSIFGDVSLSFSRCPLFQYPVEIKFNMNLVNTPQKQRYLEEYIENLVENKLYFDKYSRNRNASKVQ